MLSVLLWTTLPLVFFLMNYWTESDDQKYPKAEEAFLEKENEHDIYPNKSI
jgi:hypothetical protein